ncbi:ABC transporter ATP-binding protein [Cellulomonas triticagri]|uniref:ABC transporter ATP-binding protein n=1 Tax=Cellulomonas triticagri TaxID=2483352 RepID=A0A3M2JJX0_9CELL|nr:ABC transporter ATP-binding protein [Cellulomonas triticagri]RMI13414.1 ABC transporter ATP-binding protein [Cellulomonas triticagri]
MTTTGPAPALPTGPAPAGPSRLGVEGVTLRYDSRTVSTDLSFAVPDGSFTVIIGPNACGKSTLLRALSGLLVPAAGRVLLDGAPLLSYPARERARRLAFLPQSMGAPEGITVAELAARGRFAHQRVLRRSSLADAEAVDRALADTGTADLADRRLDELSGGQRQRAWIAMVLAQETPIVLLDEPTTYLDLTHQLEVLSLLHRLRLAGRTVVAVLHDLNHAARYASHLVAMADGRVVAQGEPDQVVTPALVRDVFGLESTVVPDPVTGGPLVVPADTR